MPPNASQFPWSTVEKVAANLLTNGFHSGISFAYDSLNSRINATATGGSGGGSINLTNLSVSSQSASGSGSLSFNDQTGVFAFTPPNLSTYTIRNAAESFASLLVNTSVSSSSTLTDSISSLTGVNPVAFPNGITPLSLITTGPGGSAGNAGQYLTSTGNGLSWVTLSAITENTSATLANLVITGNLNVIGTTTTTNLTTLNVTNSQLVLNDSVVGAPSSNADIVVNRGSSTDTAIRWNELTDRWEFTNDGITYVNLPTPTEYNNYNNLINRPTIPAAQVNSDWSATGGVTAILNKPTLFSGNYTDLTNTPTIPTLLRNFSDVSDATPTIGNILRWDGTQWAPASAAGSGGGGGTMIGPVVSTDKAITRFNGSTGLEVQNSLVIIADDGAITTPRVKNLIPFYHPTLAEFSTASGNEGAIAYSESGGALYYSHNSSWTNQRIVTTNSSTSSDLQVLIGNFQKIYSISAQDVTINNVNQSDRKALRLSDSVGITSDIIIKVSSGLNISRSTNELTLSGRTYNFTTELATGNQIKVRLQEIGIATVNTDITFAGADGLLIERTNPTTITFRAPPTTVTQYTDSLAKDAAALMLINGSKVGITYTYDSVNKVLNSVVSGGGSGGSGTVITYDLTGRNTNSNNAIIDLIPSSGLTDTIEFAGSAGTSVNWDSGNKRITIGSVAPVQADWNQTNASSLNFIQNKPTIPLAYTLPTASSSIIGGVRIGSNLSIDVNGILSANAGSYTLPVATAGTLGGIKIGSGLSIDAFGVVTASGGTATLPSIQEVSGTTASLATDTYAELNIVGHETYTIYEINASKESWIRIYTDDVSRDADITRSEGQDPISGSGLIAEIRTVNDNDTVLITPGVLGFNNDNPRTNIIYLSVTNRSISSTPITVTLTILGGSGITNTGGSGGSSYVLPIATNLVLGGIKVGANLSMDPVTGILSANAGSYTLPTASVNTLGGVKVDNTTITITNGVISTTPYSLPTATATVLGGIQIGSGLSITNGVVSATSSDSDTLYTHTASMGLNHDIGKYWTKIEMSGVSPNGYTPSFIHSLVYCGNGIVLAGSGGDAFGATGGIYRSTNYGLTWSMSFTLRSIRSFTYCGNGIVLAGSGGQYDQGDIYRSTDFGLTFTKIDMPADNEGIPSLVYCGNGVVLAGGGLYGSQDGKIYRSTNYGQTFTVVLNTFQDAISSLVYCGNGIVLAGPAGVTGAGNSIRRSTDFGLTWTAISVAPSGTLQEISSLLYCGNGIVLAGGGNSSNFGYSTNDGDIYRSTDFGLTWTKIEMGVGLEYIHSLVYCGNGVVLAGSGGSYGGGGVIGGDGDGDIYRSLDYGSTFIKIYEPSDTITSILSLVYCGNGIVLAGSGRSALNNGDIYRSDTGGVFTDTSTAQVNSDWNAVSGITQILNKPTIPAAYTLPTATATVLGGVKVASGSGLSVDASGFISATGGTGGSGITDIVLDLTPQLGGDLDLNGRNITGIGNIDVTGDITGKGLKLSYNNPTSLSTPGTSGEIRKIAGAPFWYDGVEWREFFLINATAVTQVADTDWDKTILRCDFENDANDLRFGATASLLGSAAVSSAQYKFGTKSLNLTNSNSFAYFYGLNRPEWNFEGEWTIEGWYYFNNVLLSSEIETRGLWSVQSPYTGSGMGDINRANFGLQFSSSGTAAGGGGTNYVMRFGYVTDGVVRQAWTESIASSSSEESIRPNFIVKQNQWVHVAVQRSSTGVISIIVNGNRQGGYLENNIYFYQHNNILLGKFQVNAFTADTLYMKGSLPSSTGGFIDDFRISTIARYSSTANSLPTDWNNTILRSTFDTNVNDVRFGVTPYNSGGIITTSAVKVGTASLRLQNQYLEYAHREEYNFTGAWTIEGWFYWDILGGASGTSSDCIVSKSRNTTGGVNAANWVIGATAGGTNPSNYMNFYWKNNASPTHNTASGTNLGQYYKPDIIQKWNHIAVVRMPLDGSIHFYVNGVESGSTIGNGLIDNDIFNQTTNLLRLGYYIADSGDNRYFDGYVDDFRISTIARYTATFNPPTTALPVTAYNIPTTALPITGSTTTIIPTNSSNTFGISAETATGANAKLRLSKSNSTVDDILLVGAGGLTISRTDDSTITFTGGGGSGVTQVNSDWTSTSGLSQILNKPTLFSGSYTDLTNKPTIPAAQIQSDWTQSSIASLDYIKNKPTLATVATSGSYADLTSKPTTFTPPIATATVLGGVKVASGSGLSVDASGFISATGGTGGSGITDIIADTTPQLGGNLDTNAFDITGGTSSTIELQGQSSKLRFHFDTFAGLPAASSWHGMFAHAHDTGAAYYAHSSSWVQLAKLSDIPAAQVNSDWNASSGLAQILNKPTLFSGSYTDLTNKPTIPSAYSLPTASNTVLGGVKVASGSGLSVDASGFISATGGATTSATFTAVVGVDHTIDTFDTATSNYKTAEYTLYISNNTKIQSQKVLLMQDGTNVYTQEYAIMSNSAGTIASVIATMSAGVVTIKLSPTSGISGSTTYKFTREVLL